jgi:hypothetical protein
MPNVFPMLYTDHITCIDFPRDIIEKVKNELASCHFECFETLVGGFGAGALDAIGVITAQEFMEIQMTRYNEIVGWKYFA